MSSGQKKVVWSYWVFQPSIIFFKNQMCRNWGFDLFCRLLCMWFLFPGWNLLNVGSKTIHISSTLKYLKCHVFPYLTRLIWSDSQSPKPHYFFMKQRVTHVYSTLSHVYFRMVRFNSSWASMTNGHIMSALGRPTKIHGKTPKKNTPPNHLPDLIQ